MIEASKYWQLVRLDAAEASGGYKVQPVPLAQQFFQSQFVEPGERSSMPQAVIQLSLFKIAQMNPEIASRSQSPEIPHPAAADATSPQLEQADPSKPVQAELCLRCYVSHPILHTCVKQARLFGAGNRFTYRDLLPFVLDDDGSVPLNRFIPFSIEILRSFNADRKASLAGWTELRVKRHAELNQFLLDCGLRFSSDWAVLNKVNPKKLPSPDRDLVEAFHQVYRRQRSQQSGVRSRCPDPTEDQLREMMRFLHDRHLFFPTSRELIARLKQVASRLRQEAIWGQRGAPLAESLEITDPETGETIARDIPDPASPMDALEQQERSHLQAFCREQFLQCLDAGIHQGIADRIASLQQRPRYADLAIQVIPALRLLYFEGKSQGQIAAQLGMTNQSQVSRILDLKGLLVEVRRHLLEKLLHALLQKAQELGLTEAPTQPNYLNNLLQELDRFVDDTVFRDAVVELTNSKNRAMNSLYAQRIREILAAL